MSPSEIVLAAFAAIFGDFDPQAANDWLAPEYIQHNLAFPNGSAPVIGAIPALQESGITVTTHRVISEGDMVVLHNTYDNAQMFGSEMLVAFDVFRVEGGQVAEHWDNLQAWVDPADAASGRSMVDGPTEITDRDMTEANKALVVEFVETVLVNGDASTITDYISTEQYDQHNPLAGDGLEGLGVAMEWMASQNMEMAYIDVPLVVAEGNFVFTGAEGTFGGAPTAFFDLFRVEGGRIVEHWDVVSQIPAQSEWQNDNGKF